jgi:hypothetical protein
MGIGVSPMPGMSELSHAKTSFYVPSALERRLDERKVQRLVQKCAALCAVRTGVRSDRASLERVRISCRPVYAALRETGPVKPMAKHADCWMIAPKLRQT